jgi:membrane-associated protein
VVAGYFFGNIPIIRENLNVIVLVGVGAAALPVAFAALIKTVQALRNKRQS